MEIRTMNRSPLRLDGWVLYKVLWYILEGSSSDAVTSTTPSVFGRVGLLKKNLSILQSTVVDYFVKMKIFIVLLGCSVELLDW
jgi:hypothetical protein